MLFISLFSFFRSVMNCLCLVASSREKCSAKYLCFNVDFGNRCEDGKVRRIQGEILWSRSDQKTTIKAAKYEIQKSSTCRATLFRCKFSSMFPVFYLAWSTWTATKTFVAGWRNAARWLVDLLGHEEICCATSCVCVWWKTSHKAKICCSK